MSAERLIIVLTGAIGLAGAAWKLFVEVDAWLRNRRHQPKLPLHRSSEATCSQDANDEGNLAESEGFEPPIPLRVLLISNQVPSAARPALQNRSTV